MFFIFTKFSQNAEHDITNTTANLLKFFLLYISYFS